MSINDKIKKLLEQRYFQEFRSKSKKIEDVKELEKLRNTLEENKFEAFAFLEKYPKIKYDSKEWRNLSKIIPFTLVHEDYKEALVEEEENLLEPLSAQDLLEMEIPETEWVVENFIPEEGIGILAGPRASFKSWLALYFTVHIAKGKNIFEDYKVKEKRVLYIDEENSLQGQQKRLKYVSQGKCNNLFFFIRKNINFHDKEILEQIENVIKENNINFIVVDTFNKVFSIENENKAEEYVEIFRRLIKPLREKYKLTWLFIHHPRKGIQGNNGVSDFMDEVRGSSEFVNTADYVLTMKRISQNNNLVNLRVSKMRTAGEILPCKLIIDIDDENQRMEVIYEGELEETKSAVEEMVVKILTWVSDNGMIEFRTKEVNEALKDEHSTATIARALKKLVDTGELHKPKKGFYTIPNQSNQSNQSEVFDWKKESKEKDIKKYQSNQSNRRQKEEKNQSNNQTYSLIDSLIDRKKSDLFANSERGLTEAEMLEEEGHSKAECKKVLNFLLKKGICFQNPSNMRFYPNTDS